MTLSQSNIIFFTSVHFVQNFIVPLHHCCKQCMRTQKSDM